MKRVNIIEAIKANEHSRVRIVNDVWIDVGQLKEMKYITTTAALAEWEIEQKPLELWVNVYKGSYGNAYETREKADAYADSNRTRCVKMIEVDE